MQPVSMSSEIAERSKKIFSLHIDVKKVYVLTVPSYPKYVIETSFEESKKGLALVLVPWIHRFFRISSLTQEV